MTISSFPWPDFDHKNIFLHDTRLISSLVTQLKFKIKDILEEKHRFTPNSNLMGI